MSETVIPGAVEVQQATSRTRVRLLGTDEIIVIPLPFNHMVAALGSAFDKGQPFLMVPKITGSMLLSISAIASLEPHLATE